MTDTPTAPGRRGELRFSTMAWLLTALLLAAAPHASKLPIWLSGLFVVSICWRLAIAMGFAPFPNRWLLMAATIGTALATVVDYGMLIGPESGTALLVGMSGLKLLETRDRRDCGLAVLLGYLLVVTWFFHAQEVQAGLYLVASVTVLTCALVAGATVDRNASWRDPIRPALILLVQALPFAFLLFLLVPRIHGPLWALPNQGDAGITGIDDSMTPGAIARLAESSRVAFRTRFGGAPPGREKLYWRGPVLTRFDGRTWTRGAPSIAGSPGYQPLSKAVEYSVILEPHGQRWLFALDLPSKAPARATLNREYELLWQTPIDRLLMYRVRSHPEYRQSMQLAPPERASNLHFPPGSNPLTRNLGEQWRKANLTAWERVERALSLYRQQPFVYTLSPPIAQIDASDRFLFETKRGFCEHFASSFVLLMRAAGVPARVITGYQGGEMNTLGKYLIVRQSDAHAWAEVWIQDTGWVRVDPTAAVAPERIELGVHAAVAERSRMIFGTRVDLGWLHRVALAWDTLNNHWNEWVVGYGAESQRTLLAKLGISESGRAGLLAGLLLGMPLCALAVWLLANWCGQRSQPRNPTAIAYERFCARLGKLGLERGTAESPRAFATRAAGARPDLQRDIHEITELYATLRFAPGADDRLFAVFQRRVSKFRPKNQPRRA